MVIRVNKTSNYTVMSNYHFKDKNLSLKGKGLLSLMLSLPDSWDYSIAGLCTICKENETAIKSALNELKKCGYLEVTKLYPGQSQSGRIEYIYDIFEQPKKDIVQDISEAKEPKKQKRFQKPTLQEIRDYCLERGNSIDPERFMDYYESNGWKVGKNPMKDWKAAVRTWEANEKKYSESKQTIKQNKKIHNFGFERKNDYGSISNRLLQKQMQGVVLHDKE